MGRVVELSTRLLLLSSRAGDSHVEAVMVTTLLIVTRWISDGSTVPVIVMTPVMLGLRSGNYQAKVWPGIAVTAGALATQVGLTILDGMTSVRTTPPAITVPLLP